MPEMHMPARDRAHHDRLMTWASGVFGRMDGEMLWEVGDYVRERAAGLAKDKRARGDGDRTVIAAVLAEIGFWAVIDSMLDQINAAERGDKE